LVSLAWTPRELARDNDGQQPVKGVVRMYLNTTTRTTALRPCSESSFALPTGTVSFWRHGTTAAYAAAASIIREHREELAGVIVEPFQRLLKPKPGFLQALRAVTEECGIPLIFDEIVTGFRFAYGGAQEYYGVVPDICTLGKIIGGGFPLAAVAGRADRHWSDGSEVVRGN